MEFNYRPYLQFYKDIFVFALTFGVIVSLLKGLIWGFLLFSTFGVFFGFAGFMTFKKNERYFYYNLGITKRKLLAVGFVINLVVGIPLFLVLIALITLINGGTSSL